MRSMYLPKCTKIITTETQQKGTESWHKTTRKCNKQAVALVDDELLCQDCAQQHTKPITMSSQDTVLLA